MSFCSQPDEAGVPAAADGDRLGLRQGSTRKPNRVSRGPASHGPRRGRRDGRLVFATGAAAYVLGYGSFAIGSHAPWVIALSFAAAGAGIGLAEPTQSAVVSQLLPDHLRGSGFGVLGAVQTAGDVVATVVAGVLYTVASPGVAFAYAAAWMVAAVFASGLLRAPRS